MADRNGADLRRLLDNAERRSDATMRRGSRQVKTPGSRSRALLVRVTFCDQRLAGVAFFDFVLRIANLRSNVSGFSDN